MGAIKDLVDLVTQLSNSVKDRKFDAELREIQGMIGGIQSEQAALHEQRIALMTENAELKKQIATLQKEIEKSNTPQPNSIDKLSEEAQKVLLLLTKHTDITAAQISHNISLELTRTEYWLGILADANFVCASYSIMDDTTYSIGQNGREYLVKNNLI